MVTPQDIFSSMEPRPPLWSGRVPTYTGTFTPLDPRVEEVRPLDIIYGLAGTYRFGGQTNPRMTIAEHAVGVSLIIEHLWGPQLAAAGLLHDACEAYTHDIQSPLRKHLTVTLPTGEVISWDEADLRINIAVFNAFGIDPRWIDHEQVRAADILSVTFEKAQSLSLDKTDWGLPPIPEELKDFRYHFLSPEDAFTELSHRWVELGLPPLIAGKTETERKAIK